MRVTPAGIFHLQTIYRAVVVADFTRAQNPVAVFDEGGEGNFQHDAMKANRGQTASREWPPPGSNHPRFRGRL